MKIVDKVYGEEEITEQVLIDLINSKAVQRLKGISQQGVPRKYNPQPFFSRYEHSIGVLILLRKFGATVKEQIAGVIHDISHTAFSHLVDWIMGDPKLQDHQDSSHEDVLKNSDLVSILMKYQYDVEDFFDLEKYSLLEQESPDLCADRIDYTLRELVSRGGKSISDNILKYLIVKGGVFIFSSASAAHSFAEEYSALQLHNWGDDRNNTMFLIFADALKKAIDINVISKEDFLQDDKYIVYKLENSNDRGILASLDLLKRGFWLDYSRSDRASLIKCKYRFVDPKVIVGNRIQSLSEISDLYKKSLDLHKEHFETPRYAEAKPR